MKFAYYVAIALTFCASLVAVWLESNFPTSKGAKEMKRRKLKQVMSWVLVGLIPVSALITESISASDAAELKLLKELASPRIIAESQREAMLRGLKPASSDKVRIWAYPSDHIEQKNYASEIASILIEAGFKVEFEEAKNWVPDITEGLVISHATNSPYAENGRRIVKAFEVGGILFKRVLFKEDITAEKLKDNLTVTTDIMVGPKERFR